MDLFILIYSQFMIESNPLLYLNSKIASFTLEKKSNKNVKLILSEIPKIKF